MPRLGAVAAIAQQMLGKDIVLVELITADCGGQRGPVQNIYIQQLAMHMTLEKS